MPGGDLPSSHLLIFGKQIDMNQLVSSLSFIVCGRHEQISSITEVDILVVPL